MGSYIVGYPSPQWQYNQKMDIDAILLSLKLAFWTMALILPFGIWVAHKLIKLNRSRPWIEAALALPLVLPPTVLGYYFLVSFGNKSIFGIPLVFSFTGILLRRKNGTAVFYSIADNATVEMCQTVCAKIAESLH